MAFDQGLAERIREMLGNDRFTEKKMFGGLAFMSGGNMFIGITGETLMARVGPEHYATALAQPHARVMDFTGKPMKGYVFVDPPGFENDAELGKWIDTCRSFVSSLPPK